MTETADRPNVDHGDGEVARRNTILRTEVGSGLHGLAIEGTDDHDEMGVFIEPREYVTGIAAWSYVHNRKMHSDGHGLPHYTFRTKPNGERSGPGDTDLSMYSLRKYTRLAAKGNPTVLLPLWAPSQSVYECDDLGARLRSSKTLFLSLHAVHRFLAYMEAQRERMMGGGRQGKVPNRPELVERYGFDTKYASHALRLSIQGLHLARDHQIILPMRESDRELCLSVKRGEIERDRVNDLIVTNASRTQALLDRDRVGLPAEPDYAYIDALLDLLHVTHWQRQRHSR